MQQPREVINEIQKGLEGLEMLAQWQLSLARDLHEKATRMLKSISEDVARQEPPAPAK